MSDDPPFSSLTLCLADPIVNGILAMKKGRLRNRIIIAMKLNPIGPSLSYVLIMIQIALTYMYLRSQQTNGKLGSQKNSKTA